MRPSSHFEGAKLVGLVMVTTFDGRLLGMAAIQYLSSYGRQKSVSSVQAERIESAGGINDALQRQPVTFKHRKPITPSRMVSMTETQAGLEQEAPRVAEPLGALAAHDPGAWQSLFER